MPFKVISAGDKFDVINADTGEKKNSKPFATRAKAEAYARALNANSDDMAEKSGSRNNKADRFTIRTIRQQALALAELTRQLEPGDTDEEPEAEEGDMLSEMTELAAMSEAKYAKSLGLTLAGDVLAVKSIGQDEIRGYAMLWGSANMSDLETEYFTQKTDFWDGTLGKSARPLTFDHAQDATFKANPVIGTIKDFGDDDVGRWYIAKLDRSHKYRKAIDALIAGGKLGTSSDSAPQYVERVKTGKATWLKTWPFFAAALTDQPCEPRMLTDGSLEYLKSFGITLPDVPDMVRQVEILQLRTRVLKLKGD